MNNPFYLFCLELSLKLILTYPNVFITTKALPQAMEVEQRVQATANENFI